MESCSPDSMRNHAQAPDSMRNHEQASDLC